MKTKFDDIKSLSAKKLIEGIRHCYENSDNLFESAIVLKHNKKYNVATSILVLSIEELVKSSALYNILFTDDEEVKESFRDIFESNVMHKNRHDFALFMNEYLKTINFHKLKMADIQMDTPEEFSTFLHTQINFKRIFVNVEKEKKTLNNWFSHANARKNNGLYVAYSSKWQTPSIIDQKEFEIALNETKKLRADLGMAIQALLSENLNEIDNLLNFMKESLKQFLVEIQS